MRFWPFRPSLPKAASTLGRHGAQVRHARERERIRAKAREMRAAMGMPKAEALG